MSYVVLARKYRPQDFDDVIGQEHITDILKSAVESKRLGQAYLFCGPRGVGKTSCARILAKCLNCQDGMKVHPNHDCFICQEIAKGTSLDVLEIDGASNRGIDEIRSLRENVKFAPTYGRYKIYIVDEVHMLTMEAFNALLKTLEEPPEHVKFIFATTTPQKVPSTIISRCQRFDFKRIPLNVLVDSLSALCKKEGLQFDQEALFAIAKAAEGGMRDALSILDQLGSVKEKRVELSQVYSMLGLVEQELLFALMDHIASKNCAQSLLVLNEIIDKGKDIRQLMRDLIEHLRHLMILKVGGKTLGKLIDYPIAVKEKYLLQSQNFTLDQILKAIELLIQAQEEARIVESLRTPLEVCLAKLTYSAAAPQIVQPQKAAAPEYKENISAAAPRKTTFSEVLKDKKGEVSLNPEPKPQTPSETPVQKITPGDVDSVKRIWDTLTFAVSRERMSIATFLQDGVPISFNAPKLIIGFPHKASFQKESLEDKDNIKLVEKVFAEKLNQDIIVQYKFIEEILPAANEDEPHIKSALETFGGKIVSRWHNE